MKDLMVRLKPCYLALRKNFSYFDKHIVEMRLSPKIIDQDESTSQHKFAQRRDLGRAKIRPTHGIADGHALPVHVEKYILE